MKFTGKALDVFFLKYRRLQLARTSLETVFIVLTLFFIFCTGLYFIESMWYMSDEERISVLAFAVLAPLLCMVVQLGRYRQATDTYVSSLNVEKNSGVSFFNELVTAVELSDEDVDESSAYGYSSELISACISSASEKIKRIDPRSVISFRRAQYLACITIISIIPFSFLCYVHPFEMKAMVWGYLSIPGGYTASTLDYPVSPGMKSIASGSEIGIQISCPREITSWPVLERISLEDGSMKRTRAVMSDTLTADEQRIYSVTIPNVVHGFFYRFALGPLRTNTFEVSVVEPPSLLRGTVTYRYPSYTGLGDEIQQVNLLDVRAPQGTTVVWTLKYSKPIESATLQFEGAEYASIVTNDEVSFEMAPEQSGKYSIHAIDKAGFTDPRKRWWTIDLYEDRIPRTFVLSPAEDMSVEASSVNTVFDIKVFSEDDYGILGGSLVYTLRQRYEYTFSEFEQTVPLLFPSPLTRLTTTIPMDLTRSILQPGDSISYHFQVYDGFVPRRWGKTRVWKISVPYKTDDFDELLKDHQKEIVSVDSVLERQKEIDEALKDVVKRAADKKDLKWRDRQELKKLVEKQKKLRKDAQEITANLDKTIKKVDEKSLLDEGALKKLQEVHELMAEVTDTRMKNLMQKMQDLMTQSSFDRKKMDSVMKSFDKENYVRELEKVLKNLKKIKAQQELTKAIHDTGKLVEEQEKLLQKTMEKGANDEDITSLEKPQNELAERTMEHQKQLEKLSEDLKEHYPEAADQVKKEVESKSTSQASENMKQAASEMKKDNASSAMEKQQNALNKMRSTLEELKQINGKMKKKEAAINIEAVKTLIYKAVELSEVAAAIAPEPTPMDVLSQMPATSALRRDGCRKMALESAAVWRRFVRFEGEFNRIFADELMFKASFLTAISDLIDSSSQAQHDFEQVAYFSGIQLIRKTSSKFNNIILQLLLLVKKMKEQSAQSSQQDFMEQMEEMIKRQEQLNEMCNRQGQRPKANPMMQQMFNQMAAEQEMIRQSMEDLAKRYEEGMKLDEKLQKVSEEMKEVEERLRKMDGGEGTRNAQKKILTRMLDYTRSMHNQDYSRERKSKAGIFEGTEPEASMNQDLLETRQEIFKNMTGDGYPPEFKEQVERYLKAVFEAGSPGDGDK